MAKIYFDEANLERFVNDGIDYAMTNIRESIRIIDMMSIPYEFKYRYYLRSLDDNIRKDLNELTYVLNTIKNSSKCFSTLKEQSKLQIKGIENYSISLRQSSIK